MQTQVFKSSIRAKTEQRLTFSWEETVRLTGNSGTISSRDSHEMLCFHSHDSKNLVNTQETRLLN